MTQLGGVLKYKTTLSVYNRSHTIIADHIIPICSNISLKFLGCRRCCCFLRILAWKQPVCASENILETLQCFDSRISVLETLLYHILNIFRALCVYFVHRLLYDNIITLHCQGRHLVFLRIYTLCLHWKKKIVIDVSLRNVCTKRSLLSSLSLKTPVKMTRQHGNIPSSWPESTKWQSVFSNFSNSGSPFKQKIKCI